MKRIKGFTIIEVLIVVAILGVLAAIAIPAVTKYTTNARRADGKTALVAAAQAMERYYTNNYTYGEMNAGTYDGASIPVKSDQSYYNITVTHANATAFTIQGQADPQGRQANDTICLTMTINQLGQKTPADCWK
ncbi:type IV pilus assembly protein PilE [Desulfonatronum thiosulfatophilum]|uniref:Type IV pilus assembly protein PilE n=1 Tax=Desulfonatronum thiosulfatophilum TaxID=617002 RepID=A0A1G6A2K7_9BACT|nr:type IV pilin protein [Desulfonatronum thiosulfatophilum]SDB02672.1 type IV pilus assembly protein PilE [Desulfonatronum thiosulfatophilum]